MPYLIYGKCLVLFVAYGGVMATTLILPNLSSWSLSLFIGELLFSPFKLLAASITFIAGFLAYSLYIQDLIRYVHGVVQSKLHLIFIILACLSWIHILLTRWQLALLTLILALFYGIMDVDLRKREK